MCRLAPFDCLAIARRCYAGIHCNRGLVARDPTVPVVTSANRHQKPYRTSYVGSRGKLNFMPRRADHRCRMTGSGFTCAGVAV